MYSANTLKLWTAEVNNINYFTAKQGLCEKPSRLCGSYFNNVYQHAALQGTGDTAVFKLMKVFENSLRQKQFILTFKIPRS